MKCGEEEKKVVALDYISDLKPLTNSVVYFVDCLNANKAGLSEGSFFWGRG